MAKDKQENSVDKESLAAAVCAAEAALDKKATKVVAIKVRPTLVIVDYFVIATVDNRLQMAATIDNIEEQLREQCGLKPLGREGLESGNWALLDYGDIVVHIFTPETRDFYRLESLYNDAESIVFGTED